MNTVKRVLAAVVVLTLMMTAVGCSTPKDAAKVGNIEFTTGEYLAYLYNAAAERSADSLVQSMGPDVWGMEYSYDSESVFVNMDPNVATSDETAATDNMMKLEELVKQAAKDKMIYCAAIQTIADENGIKISDEDLQEASNILAMLDKEGMLDKGISEESFKKMFLRTSYLPETVFFGLYGTDGKTPTAAADIDKYFADNYVSFEYITVELEKDNVDLSEEEIAEKKAELEAYRNVYYATGDFDKAVEAEKAAKTKDAETNEIIGVEGLDKEQYNVDYDGEPAEDVTSASSKNIQNMDATKVDAASKNLVDAVRTVEEGSVDIVEYEDATVGKVMALVYRFNPNNVQIKDVEDYKLNGGLLEAIDGSAGITVLSDESTEEETTYKPLREAAEKIIISSLRNEDFKTLVKTKMEELKKSASFNERTMKMCDPKAFFETE